MGTHYLVEVLGPHEVAHLRPCVDGGQRHVVHRVPEADAPICCAPARGQQAMLVRRPRDGLHRRLVLIELQDRLVTLQGPHAKLVVVAS